MSMFIGLDGRRKGDTMSLFLEVTKERSIIVLEPFMRVQETVFVLVFDLTVL